MRRASHFHPGMLFLTLLALMACKTLSPQPTPAPTATHTSVATSTATSTPLPTATNTVTPTSTEAPTLTPTFTLTPALTETLAFTPTTGSEPISNCALQNGQWVSKEKAGILPAPMLTFQVSGCRIISVNIVDVVIPGELYMIEEGANNAIQDNHFIYTRKEGGGQVIVEGSFDSKNTAHGTITYTKGFFFVDFTVNKDLTKQWSAAPL